MKVAVDTSVLVAAIVASHARHGECLEWFVRINAKEIEAIASAHMPLEAYNSLTKDKVRIKPAIVQEIFATMTLNVRMVALADDDWGVFFDECSGRNVLGGAVYDFHHVFVAELEDVDRVLTLDEEDFRRLWRGRDDVLIGV